MKLVINIEGKDELYTEKEKVHFDKFLISIAVRYPIFSDTRYRYF